MAPRVRTDGPYPLPSATTFVGYSNGTSGSKLDLIQATPIAPLSRLYRRMEDTVTPGYRQMLASGGILPMNPLKQQLTMSTLAAGKTQVEISRSGYQNRDMDCFGTFAEWDYAGASSYRPALPSVNVSAMITEVQAKANASGWDVGTSMAEFSKTVAMVTNAKRSVLRMVNSILSAEKKRTARSYARVMEELNNKWLEARYGWRPLYYEMLEVSKACEALRSYSPRNFKRFSTRDSADVSSSTTFTGYNIYGNGAAYGSLWTRSCTATWARKVDVKVGVMTYDSFSSVAFVNPLGTAWELLPYSFVINWFVNVDQFLKAWAPVVSRRFAHVYVTTTTEDVLQLSSTWNIPDGNGWTMDVKSNEPSILSYTSSNKERKLTSQGPSIQFKLNMNGLKMIDLVSLTFGAINRYVRTKK